MIDLLSDTTHISTRFYYLESVLACIFSVTPMRLNSNWVLQSWDVLIENNGHFEMLLGSLTNQIKAAKFPGPSDGVRSSLIL